VSQEDPYAGLPLPEEEPPMVEDDQAPEEQGPGTGDPGEDLGGSAPAGVSPDGELTPEVLLLEHDQQIRQLQTDVGQLIGAVADLLKSPPKEKPAPWNWKHLNGPAAAKLLTELRGWVDWYNDRYGVAVDSRIPGCWYRHGPVVEELTAVWIAWRAAYYGHQSPNDAPAYWHERILWPTIKRLKDSTWAFKNCVSEHQDPRPQRTPSTDDGFVDFVTAIEKKQEAA